ncbi:unnamed protein product [Camellia sinensis]
MDFTWMMFLNGCFILQYIHYINDEEEQAKMKMKNHDKAFVECDLFLLENQLPFKVLQALMTMNSEFAGKEGLKLINKFIQNTGPSPPLHNSFWESVENLITNITNKHKKGSTKSNSQLVEPAHLLELMHRQLIEPKVFSTPGTENRGGGGGGGGGNNCYSPIKKFTVDLLKKFYTKRRRKNWHIHPQYPHRSAMDLKMVGIRFRPSYRDCLSYKAFKSTWTGRILILPKISIDDATISMLHNLAAYERCPNTFANYLWVTNYIFFLDSILDSANDVKELKYAGIITNFLSNDEEVVKIISGMAAGLVPDYRNTSYFCVMTSIEE